MMAKAPGSKQKGIMMRNYLVHHRTTTVLEGPGQVFTAWSFPAVVTKSDTLVSPYWIAVPGLWHNATFANTFTEFRCRRVIACNSSLVF
jgi:hypothetical protein